jgi:hypothetical protein
MCRSSARIGCQPSSSRSLKAFFHARSASQTLQQPFSSLTFRAS